MLHDVFMLVCLMCVDLTLYSFKIGAQATSSWALGHVLLLTKMVVAELLQWRAPPLLILIVIMLSSHSKINHTEDRLCVC